MASRVFVCTWLHSINAAFSPSAPVQTVYRGIPARLSVARSMPSLGWWPNSFLRAVTHPTCNNDRRGEECHLERQVAFVVFLMLVHARVFCLIQTFFNSKISRSMIPTRSPKLEHLESNVFLSSSASLSLFHSLFL